MIKHCKLSFSYEKGNQTFEPLTGIFLLYVETLKHTSYLAAQVQYKHRENDEYDKIIDAEEHAEEDLAGGGGGRGGGGAAVQQSAQV